MRIDLTVNGRRHHSDIGPAETLLELLRRLGYKGVKNGCAAGDCGACAVLLDGRAVAACYVFAAKADGRALTTVEGLTVNDALHPLQQAAVTEGAVQCGFCTPGILMVTAELLSHDPHPDETAVRRALSANLCRCTGYVKILRAVEAAARMTEDG